MGRRRQVGDGTKAEPADERHQLVPAPVTNVFESGTKEVFRVRLASGRDELEGGIYLKLTAAQYAKVQMSIGRRAILLASE